MKKIFFFFLLASLVMVPNLSQAQSDDPPPGPAPGDPGAEPIPFDGGLTILLAAGAAYGVKRWKEMGKSTESDQQ